MNDGSSASVDRAELVIALILAVIAGVIAWDTTGIIVQQTYGLGPKAFPYAISAALFVFSALTALAAFKGTPSRDQDEVNPVLWIVGGLLAQVALISFAGFSIATGLLFAATAKAFGKGNFLITIPVGIALSLVLWFAFAKGLTLTLPAGPLERLF